MRKKILLLLLSSLLLVGCNKETVEEPATEFTPEPLVIETEKENHTGMVEIYDANKEMIYGVMGQIYIAEDDVIEVKVYTKIDNFRAYVMEDNNNE